MLDMSPGEILVTTSTTPSLMLAVEKAAGIVTDEGGMLCHAAIVSREFDIPCVIGTDNATRRLRTGDTIDMSAGEGKVKIVSRAPPSVKPGR
jgi:pyruvate,water dikinase